MRQLVEGSAPAAIVAIALLDRQERHLLEGHAGLPAFLGESHRHQVFFTALAVLLPGKGEDETPVFNDLDGYRNIPLTSMPYGQAMAILALGEFKRVFI